MNSPPTLLAGREALCVAVELSQTPSYNWNPWTPAQLGRVLQNHWLVRLVSDADLVCWGGPLKLHIILVFIIFSLKATALTQAFFVSVCLPCPSTHHHPLLSYLLNTFGTGLPLWLKNTNVSIVAFFPPRLSFGSARPQETLAGWKRVPPSCKFVSIYSKATLHQMQVFTAHFSARTAGKTSLWPREITYS